MKRTRSTYRNDCNVVRRTGGFDVVPGVGVGRFDDMSMTTFAGQ